MRVTVRKRLPERPVSNLFCRNALATSTVAVCELLSFEKLLCTYIHTWDHGRHSSSKCLWRYCILQVAAGIRIWAALLALAKTEVPLRHACASTEVFVHTSSTVTSIAYTCCNDLAALISWQFRRAKTPPCFLALSKIKNTRVVIQSIPTLDVDGV